MKTVSVLFICMGNICRSPLAHGRFEHLVREHGLESRITVDSAGTHAYHVGEPPDRRSQQTAMHRGIDISGQRARKVSLSDFEEFDYLLAMDRDNLAILLSLAPAEHAHKVRLFLEFAPELDEQEVPDPYYGGQSGFEIVYDLIDAASQGLLDEIRKRHF